MQHVPSSDYARPARSRTSAWLAQRRRNARMGWVLGSVALAFFAGFMVRMLWLGA